MKAAIILVLISYVSHTAPAYQNPDQAKADELNLKVIQLYKNGKFKDALPLARQVVELRTANPDANKINVVEAHYNLASVYEGLNSLSEALRSFQNALDINQSARPDHLSNAQILDRIGHLYELLQDYSSAVIFRARALDFRENILGKKHPDTVRSLLNTAVLYLLLGEEKKSDTLLSKFEQTKDVLARSEYENTILQMACRIRGMNHSREADRLEEIIG